MIFQFDMCVAAATVAGACTLDCCSTYERTGTQHAQRHGEVSKFHSIFHAEKCASCGFQILLIQYIFS